MLTGDFPSRPQGYGFVSRDSQNRLVKVVKGGIASEFTYGCDGLRRRSVVTNTAGEQTRTDYVIDGQSVVQEIVKHRVNTNASWGAATLVSYLQGPSGPLYRHVSGTTDVSWYVYDGLGSVVGEVDVSGNLTATKKHDVYGLTRSVTGTPTSRHGFVGGLGHVEDDETGYLYMRARHYDPETGRFASQDPAYDGMNWFTYCSDDPVNSVDYTGKFEGEGSAWALGGVFFAAMVHANTEWAATGGLNAVASVALALAAVYCFVKALGCVTLELNMKTVTGGAGVLIAGEYLKKFIGSELEACIGAIVENGKLTSHMKATAALSAAVTTYSLILAAGVVGCEILY